MARRSKPVEEGEGYIQTWLPHANLLASAAALHPDDLARQRIHNWQLISLLSCYLVSDENLWHCCWREHPLVLQWKNYLPFLMEYNRAVAKVYNRGSATGGQLMPASQPDPVLTQCEELFDAAVEAGACDAEVSFVPGWIGNAGYHASHQSNLVRKNPEFYSNLFPNVTENLKYVWPR